MATNNEFAFVPVTGTLTPGQVVTGVINLGNPSFTPSPFALVFSASDSGPLATITLPPFPSPTNTQSEFFSFIVPTLTATSNLLVLVEYIGIPNGAFAIGTVDITTATGASANSSTTSTPSTGTSISSSTTTGTSSTANGTSTGASGTTSTIPPAVTSSSSTATPKSSSTKTDMTVGIAIGVVAFVAIFGTLLLVYMRRRRRSFAFNNIAVVSPFPEVRSPGEEPPSIEQRQTTLPAILNEDIPPRKGHRRRIPRPVPPTREPKRGPPDPVRIEAVTGTHREESMEVIPEPTSDVAIQSANNPIAYRHQDSGWRDLVRNETADGLREIIELPPDYSEV